MGLLHAGELSHSGHADLSARVGPGTVLIATLNRTRDLVPDDLAVVRLDGSVAEGDPGGMSTEVVAMHTEVYRVRPQAGAVIHTHSRTCWRSPWRACRCRPGTNRCPAWARRRRFRWPRPPRSPPVSS